MASFRSGLQAAKSKIAQTPIIPENFNIKNNIIP
jgi:hypothetical protein